MPPPSMLRIVMSFPVDGGGCGTVVSAVPVLSMAETGAEIKYQRIQEGREWSVTSADAVLLGSCALDDRISAGSGKLFVRLREMVRTQKRMHELSK